MSTKECCRTCHHCLSFPGSTGSWCRLRKIKVHPDIAPFAVCHHWTKRAPSLPKFDEKFSEVCTDRQLEFGRALVSIDN
ncbi:metal-binding protein [Prochlorococcus sp. MIT 1307]|uniref:metal-binding protein n=1 Tax=Prochlorococcus sp. MIT 1307 TaxID=3096219 RepID=UPI002A7605E5|nr:metal-binding protein [Prochlorococcus sp. MIT 1307]